MNEDTNIPKDLLQAECCVEKEEVPNLNTNIHTDVEKLSDDFAHITLDQESNKVPGVTKENSTQSENLLSANINLTGHETLPCSKIKETNGNDILLSTVIENLEKVNYNNDAVSNEMHAHTDESVSTLSNINKPPQNVLQILNLTRSSTSSLSATRSNKKPETKPKRELHWRTSNSSEIKSASWRARQSSSWRQNDSSSIASGNNSTKPHKFTSYVPARKIQTPIQVTARSTDDSQDDNLWRPSILSQQGNIATSGASWRTRLAAKESKNGKQSSFSCGTSFISPLHQEHSAVPNKQPSNCGDWETQKGKDTEKNTVTEEDSKPLVNTLLKSLINAPEEKVVSALQENKNNFSSFICKELSQNDFYLVLQLLNKVCNCKTKLQEKSFILSTCCHYKFLDQFVSQIMKLYQLDNKKINFILQNMLIFLETITIQLPYTALDKASSQIKAGLACLKGIKSYSNLDISDEILEKFENLDADLEKLKKVKEDTNISRESRQELLQQQLPPEDFRHLSTCPTKDNVLQKDKPFLRPNLVSGKYQDVQHYLDVQFRLLREDFLRPLREGIAEYRAHGNTRNTSVRVYKDTEFVPTKLMAMEWTKEDENYWFPCNRKDRGTKRRVPPYFGNVVNLNIKTKKYSQLIASKKLMHGSLLCFTKNNFDSLLFATVSNRGDRHTDFPQGAICIEFCDSVTEDIFSSPYLMFECDVFFEPYYHVLNVLKSVDPKQLPMAKYLVDMSQDETRPSHLKSKSNIILKGLDDSQFQVNALDKTSWPTAEDLGLNPSQFQALQAGLTHELAVIQGPPGTGKTFIALKIAQALIENKVSSQPIIVVCLTNHALDQFLLGIQMFTEEIVRIGGQSKVPELEQYNLKNLDLISSTWNQRYNVWLQKLRINYLRNDMVYFESFLAVIQNKIHLGIISMNTFQSYEVISYNTRNSVGNDFLEWLIDETEVNETSLGIPKYKDQFLCVVKNHRNYNNQNYCDGDDFYELQIDHERAEFIQELKENEKIHRMITLKCLDDKIRNVEMQMQGEESEENIMFMFVELETVRGKKSDIEKHLKRKTPATAEELNMWQYVNLWSLTSHQRWKLYWHWVDLLENAVLEKIDYCRHRMKCLKEELDNWGFSNSHDKYHVLARKDVIGLTTTGMARLHDDIGKLNPQIVIVEEAAEVLESHIVASLSKSCKQLILIGDHKQLRPSTSVYQLAKQFNFDVSLFERLVQGRGGCITLGVQHRMYPCIASLVTPSIYPQLESHSSTLLLEPVKGIPKRLFFVTHSHTENQESVEETSHSNEFEANFAVGLCNYVRQQGYSAENVVLLTTYVGQMNLIQKKIKRFDLLQKVRVTVVDNFQGEESDIIILSLVRSNCENSIGFLATENRVCVALSRARNGLYIIGNMKCLTKGSNIWTKINSTLEEQDAIGTAIPISCQNHLENGVTAASCGEDFERLAPLGGCDKPCLINLACGHPCNRTCHIQTHETIWCHVLVDKVRAVCNHTNTMQCHQNPDQVPCQTKCEIPLNCGHECKSKCHLTKKQEEDHTDADFCIQPCTKLHPICGHTCHKRCGQQCGSCTEQIEITLDCGHIKTTECGMSKDFKCMKIVKKKLQCGHITQAGCGVDILNLKCTEKCTKILKCGHECELACSKDCASTLYSISQCMKDCTKILSCGHHCQLKCFKKCGPCETIITKILPSCGHIMEQKCGENTEKVCLELCSRTLECGHVCKVSCCGGEKCKPCSTEVEKIIPDCGHSVRVACSSGVPQRKLCTQLCERTMECGHACQQMCFESCVCNEKTTITIPDICGHHVNLLCKEINTDMKLCAANRCVEPCGQMLKCGHICNGTCTSCLQGRLHIPCTQQCFKTLVCGHKCQGPCNITCPPCEQPCQYKCPHSSCQNKCSEPCTPCKKPCSNQCIHTTCHRRCRAICDVSPCTQPCKKLLNCQHPCMGMCGDPCPLLCFVCQPEKMQELFDEQTPIAEQRVVQIVSCGHIVSVKEFDARFNTSQVCVPDCPRCGEIIFLQRYTSKINRHFVALTKIKQSTWFPTLHVVLKKNLLIKLKKNDAGARNMYMSRIKTSLTNLQSKLHSFSSLNDTPGCLQQIHAASVILYYLNNVWDKNNLEPLKNPLLCAQSDVLLDFVNANFGMFGEQQVHDLTLEVLRLHRVAQLEELLKVKNEMTATKLHAVESTVGLNSMIDEASISFEENLTQLNNIVLNYTTFYSETQDAIVKDLVESLLKDIQNHKDTCKLIQQFEVTIKYKKGGVLDVSKGNWYLCSSNHVTFIINKNKGPKCSTCSI